MHTRPTVSIYQGKQNLKHSDVNIIIDVIRAFTVSHYAFIHGVEDIFLTNYENEALELKNKNKNIILAGEIEGYKIKSFDFGNSPYDLSITNLKNKTLVQKTTNGVKAALNSLDSNDIFITGYSNAKITALYVKSLIQKSKKSEFSINIIASHPSGDDDLACAEFIRKLILEEIHDTKKLEEQCVNRIVHSDAAKKFYSPNNKDFSILDISLCTILQNYNFVMKVKKDNNLVKIYKKELS